MKGLNYVRLRALKLHILKAAKITGKPIKDTDKYESCPVIRFTCGYDSPSSIFNEVIYSYPHKSEHWWDSISENERRKYMKAIESWVADGCEM